MTCAIPQPHSNYVGNGSPISLVRYRKALYLIKGYLIS